MNDSLRLINLIYKKSKLCNSNPVWEIVNTFDHKIMNWTTSNFLQKYSSKFDNCSVLLFPMVVHYYDQDHNDEILSVQYKNENSSEYVTQFVSGYILEFVKLFAEKHEVNLRVESYYNRYKIRDYPPVIIYISNEVAQNGNYLDTLKLLEEMYAFPIFRDSLTFIVPRGSEYTPFEKLLLPFDLTTWIMMIITFIIGYVTILIIFQCSRYFQSFRRWRDKLCTPISLLQIIFGIRVLRTPTRSYARFLFISFSLYCLMIRTAYLLKMFDLLHRKIEKPALETIETIEDLIKYQIPVYVSRNQVDFYGRLYQLDILKSK
jgi:hypothetical protein